MDHLQCDRLGARRHREDGESLLDRLLPLRRQAATRERRDHLPQTFLLGLRKAASRFKHVVLDHQGGSHVPTVRERRVDVKMSRCDDADAEDASFLLMPGLLCRLMHGRSLSRGAAAAVSDINQKGFPMCKVFTPEDYFACGNGTTDDLAAFTAMIAAMSDGDVAQLAGKTYRLGGTLHVNKRIAIAGEIVNPHYASHRSRLYFPPNVLGLRLLRGATLRDLAVVGEAVGGQPGTDTDAHGVWCRRTSHLENVFVQRFGGHGVSLDTRTIQSVVSAISVAIDSSNRSIATATVTGNTGLLSVTADMEIELFGYTVSTPSAGGIALSATASAIQFELPGAPSGPLAGITRTVSSASVTVVATVRQCTANVGSGHGLLPNMSITTTDAIDTPVLSVGGSTVTFALTTAGPGPVQGDSLTVTRGLIRTIQNCDHWQAENVRCNGNRGHGWHTLGARSNAGCAINLDCTSNYQSGIHEESFLGNTYVACHTAANSLGSSNPVWPSYNKPRNANNN